MKIQEHRSVLKTRCPSYCLRCLRVIPPLVVGLANWLSTPRLPVFGVQFQERRRRPPHLMGPRSGNERFRTLSLSLSLSLSLFALSGSSFRYFEF